LERISSSQFSPTHRKLTIFKVIEIFSMFGLSENPKRVEKSFYSLELSNKLSYLISRVQSIPGRTDARKGKDSGNQKHPGKDLARSQLLKNCYFLGTLYFSPSAFTGPPVRKARIYFAVYYVAEEFDPKSFLTIFEEMYWT
jgi:hypothetical protein